MPIYEYQCSKCQHLLEVIQKVDAEALSDCPECGASALRKLVSATAFRLKGGGWYETDFKGDKQRNVHKADKEPAGKKKDSVGGDKSKQDVSAKKSPSTSSSSEGV